MPRRARLALAAAALVAAVAGLAPAGAAAQAWEVSIGATAKALSADGTVAMLTDASVLGRALVYLKSGDTWSNDTLTAGDSVFGDVFGAAAALDGNGTTAIVGASEALSVDEAGGAAYVFVRTGAAWTLQTRISGADTTRGGDQFGSAVALSADGSTALVGAPGFDHPDESDSGAAYVFVRSGTAWSQEAQLAKATPSRFDEFGAAVSLSSDGSTALVGAQYDSEDSSNGGAAYVFTRSGAVWSQQARLTASDGAADALLGAAVTLSGDGSTALAGAPGTLITVRGAEAGAAYIFTRSGTAWSQQAKAVSATGAAGDMFGSSVTISDDGSAAIVGATNDDFGPGATYVFEREGTSWAQLLKLANSGSPVLGGEATAALFDGSDEDGVATVALRESEGACGSGEVTVLFFCVACPAGSFCATPAAAEGCPAGSYCPEGSTAPIACDDGDLCEAGASARAECPAGSFCATPAAAAEGCPAGSYCPAGSTAAIACEDGDLCEAGASARAECPAGFFCETPAAAAEPCPDDEFCPAGSVAGTRCRNCDFPLEFCNSTSDTVCEDDFLCTEDCEEEPFRGDSGFGYGSVAVIVAGVLMVAMLVAFLVKRSKSRSASDEAKPVELLSTNGVDTSV